jgi:hypothetical protein
MSLIALVSLLAAVVAGWHLWRATSWHPHGGLAHARGAVGVRQPVRLVRSDSTGWRLPDSMPAQAKAIVPSRPFPAPIPAPRREPVGAARFDAMARSGTGAARGPRLDPSNRHTNAGRWATDASGAGPGGNSAGAETNRPNGAVSGFYRIGDHPDASEPVTREELRLAVRAVLVHTPQQWPGGLYCSNDRSPFPCRMRHWGEQVLLAAGWDADGIDAMARQADVGLPPWLAGAGEVNPPGR